MSVNTSYNGYRLLIDKCFSNFKLEQNKILKIYGGITKDELNERFTEHVKDNKPEGFNNTWEIYLNKPLVIIQINKSKFTLEEYKDLISRIEQYLIDQLNKFFGVKCVNDRNEDGTIAQRGGSGIHDLKYGDEYKLYIFYKNSNFVFM
jgi:hypothetical protein